MGWTGLFTNSSKVTEWVNKESLKLAMQSMVEPKFLFMGKNLVVNFFNEL